MASDIEGWAAELPTEFVECRDSTLSHRWASNGADFDRRQFRYVRFIRCDRCGTEKQLFIDPKGYIVGRRSAKYPSGYLRPAGSGHLTKEENAALRIESVLRGIDAKTKAKRPDVGEQHA